MTQTLGRRGLLLVLTLITIPLLVSCGGVANPEGWASPVFDNGRTYIFQNRDRLTALNDDGSTRWRFPDDNKEEQKDIDLEAVYGTPTVKSGIIYFATYKGEAYALNTDTGSVIWKHELEGSVVGAPAITDTLFAVGTTEARVFVLDLANGTPVEPWPAQGLKETDSVWAPILIRDAHMYVATMDGNLKRYDVATAKLTWAEPFKADGAIADLAQLPNGDLFVPSLDKHVYIVSGDTGEQRSRLDLTHWAWSKPALTADGTAVAIDISGVVTAFDPMTGESRWTYETGERVKSSPVTIGDIVVVADRKPIVHFLSVTNGERLNTVPIADAGTIRADGVSQDGSAYFLTSKGRLFKADPSNRSVVEQFVGRFSQ